MVALPFLSTLSSLWGPGAAHAATTAGAGAAGAATAGAGTAVGFRTAPGIKTEGEPSTGAPAAMLAR